MGLKQYAKKSKKEETTVITARLPNSKYEWFKKYCEELGLSINEAINLLIDMELEQKSSNEYEEENQITIDNIIDDMINDEAKVSFNISIEVKDEKHLEKIKTMYQDRKRNGRGE